MRISDQSFLIQDVPSLKDLKQKVVSYREQEKIHNKWLKERLDTIMPKVMKESGLDMWVIAFNEYNEDPLYRTLLPKHFFTGRRTMCLVFVMKDGELKRLALTRPRIGIDGYYELVWINQKGSNWAIPEDYPYPPETQWECLNRVVNQYDPKTIGLNYSDDFAFGDGLSYSLAKKIIGALDEKYRDRIVSAQYAAVKWLETRSDSELAAYNGIMQIQHTMIAEAFSSKVITPGVTTSADVKYWMMQSIIDMGLEPWFDYECTIIRKDVGFVSGDDEVIMPGDCLRCDVGFRYLDLCTDTQEMAYVLRPGETDAPDYLKKALAQVNRFQDIVLENFEVGRTGNEILAASRKQAIDEGLKPSLYSHPIGFHGHAAGPTIGLVDAQNGVPVRGDYAVSDHTCYSLELNCTVEIPEWNITTMWGYESDISVADGQIEFLAGRQTGYHLIK
ncbi:MAG: M24 family metallopeptidase [Oscillospiraceae bacterium]|nr:M24 family metallopeptidase [Oscillospiraceae bacterium]